MTEVDGARGATGARHEAAPRRWLGLLAVGLVVATACVLLGRWQWGRYEHRAAVAAVVEANYDAAPVPLLDLLPGASDPLDPADEWRPVTVTGRYADGGTVVLRNRPVEGTPAVHVLAPLVVETPDGPAVLVVDRGWVPAGTEAQPDGVPAPPAGDVDVVVRLRPTEPAGRQGPPGQTYRIDPDGVLAAGGADADVLALPTMAAYGVLAAEQPSAARTLTTLPPPDTGLGPHMSYAFQWWAFAVGAVVGVVVLARRERTAVGSAAPAAGRAPATPEGAPPRPAQRQRRPTAEDEEDALIDAQLDDTRLGPQA